MIITEIRLFIFIATKDGETLYSQEKQDQELDIFGINDRKWTGMGESNSDEHYTNHCGQESLGRNGAALIHNKRV